MMKQVLTNWGYVDPIQAEHLQNIEEEYFDGNYFKDQYFNPTTPPKDKPKVKETYFPSSRKKKYSTKPLNFGKYKDLDLEQVPQDYLIWGVKELPMFLAQQFAEELSKRGYK
jgi:hypothetical protein